MNLLQVSLHIECLRFQKISL